MLAYIDYTCTLHMLCYKNYPTVNYTIHYIDYSTIHTIHTIRPRCCDLGTVTRVEAPLLLLRIYTLATLYRKMHRFYLHTIVETTISTIQRLLRECKRVEKYLNYASRDHEPKKNFILYKP